MFYARTTKSWRMASKQSRCIVTYLVARSLAHELYHHSVRFAENPTDVRSWQIDGSAERRRDMPNQLRTQVAHALYPQD